MDDSISILRNQLKAMPRPKCRQGWLSDDKTCLDLPVENGLQLCNSCSIETDRRYVLEHTGPDEEVSVEKDATIRDWMEKANRYDVEVPALRENLDTLEGEMKGYKQSLKILSGHLNDMINEADRIKDVMEDLPRFEWWM